MVRSAPFPLRFTEQVSDKLEQVLALYGGTKTSRILLAIEEYCDRKLEEDRTKQAEKLLLSRKGDSD